MWILDSNYWEGILCPYPVFTDLYRCTIDHSFIGRLCLDHDFCLRLCLDHDFCLKVVLDHGVVEPWRYRWRKIMVK